MAFSTAKLQSHVAQAGFELQRLFGLKTIGGYRNEPVRPGREHGAGLALDLMTNDLGGPSLRNPKGDAIASYLVANSARLGVDYIIWNGRSWNSRRKTWETYTGTNNPHYDHVHVSFLKQGGTGGSLVNLGDVGSTPTGVVAKMFDIDGFMDKAQGTTITVAGGMFGVALIAIGVIFAVRGTAGKAIEKKLGAS